MISLSPYINLITYLSIGLCIVLLGLAVFFQRNGKGGEALAALLFGLLSIGGAAWGIANASAPIARADAEMRQAQIELCMSAASIEEEKEQVRKRCTAEVDKKLRESNPLTRFSN